MLSVRRHCEPGDVLISEVIAQAKPCSESSPFSTVSSRATCSCGHGTLRSQQLNVFCFAFSAFGNQLPLIGHKGTGANRWTVFFAYADGSHKKGRAGPVSGVDDR